MLSLLFLLNYVLWSNKNKNKETKKITFKFFYLFCKKSKSVINFMFISVSNIFDKKTLGEAELYVRIILTYFIKINKIFRLIK